MSCGLCCDGTLYPAVDIEPDDKPAAERVGLEVVEEGPGLIFRLPCHNLRGAACSVYAIRPAVCRAYRCALLKDVDSGRVTAADARDRIKVARGLRDQVADGDPEAGRFVQRMALWTRLKEAYPNLQGAERDQAARKMLDIVTLDRFLDRWFRNKKMDSPSAP